MVHEDTPWSISHPEGLVIHTDTCKGLENAVDAVFSGVEHRECMRHLTTVEFHFYCGRCNKTIFGTILWPINFLAQILCLKSIFTIMACLIAYPYGCLG